MALLTDFIARYSESKVLGLSNPQDTAAGATDAARIAAAIADATAELELETQIELDDTDERHVAAMMDGIFYYLLIRKGTTTEALVASQERWEGWLRKLEQTEGRDRIQSKTGSRLQPTPRDTATPPRPYFDRSHFDTMRLRPPRSGSGHRS